MSEANECYVRLRTRTFKEEEVYCREDEFKGHGQGQESKEEIKTGVGRYEGLHTELRLDDGKSVMVLLFPVESSNISHIGWNPGNLEPLTHTEMFVVFKNGGIYGYKGVALDKYLTFMNSNSKGKYLISQIIKIKPPYEFTRYL